jgi:hypothetical protein
MICKCGHESKEHFNNECFHNVGMCTCWKFEPAIAANGNIEICGSITQEELAQLRNQIKELEADQEAYDIVHKNDVEVIDRQCLELEKYQWQPIETAPANVKVLLLIHIINGYNISIAHRVILGEIGDQWNTESGTYFHDTSLKMLAGWMPLPEPPKETI